MDGTIINDPFSHSFSFIVHIIFSLPSLFDCWISISLAHLYCLYCYISYHIIYIKK